MSQLVYQLTKNTKSDHLKTPGGTPHGQTLKNEEIPLQKAVLQNRF